jgi:hypothetical protein
MRVPLSNENLLFLLAASIASFYVRPNKKSQFIIATNPTGCGCLIAVVEQALALVQLQWMLLAA